MRLLLDLIIAAAIIALAWEKSLKNRASEILGLGDKPVVKTPAQIQAPIQTVAVPAPTASGEWMWDPNHHSTLDRPAYDPKDPSLRYRDAQGRKYWIDAKGVRHYDP